MELLSKMGTVDSYTWIMCAKEPFVPRSCSGIGAAVPGPFCCERMTWIWILLLWKDQLYLDPVVLKGLAVPESYCFERMTCIWILLLWKHQLYLDPVVLKGLAVPESCCFERISCTCTCTWILLCERISCTWILLLWKDQHQLYLNPVVWKIQYLEMMQWLEGPGSDALYPGSCCGESICCTYAWILLCESVRCTWILLCERIRCIWILLCERITCAWILLLIKDQLHLDPVVGKGSAVPGSCCVKGSAVPGSCCVKGPVSWDDAMTGRPRVRWALSWIL